MISKDFSHKINELLVLKEDKGTYVLFGKFRIVQESNGFLLFDLIDDSIIHEFSSLQNAFTYCVFANNKKYKELKRILDLDEQLAGIDVIVSQHRKIASQKENSDDKAIYLAKLSESQRKKRMMLEEIKSYIDVSKHWQNRKFEENKAK
jgi:cell division protein FtsI/penicillin-binding protein 2